MNNSKRLLEWVDKNGNKFNLSKSNTAQTVSSSNATSQIDFTADFKKLIHHIETDTGFFSCKILRLTNTLVEFIITSTQGYYTTIQIYGDPVRNCFKLISVDDTDYTFEWTGDWKEIVEIFITEKVISKAAFNLQESISLSTIDGFKLYENLWDNLNEWVDGNGNKVNLNNTSTQSTPTPTPTPTPTTATQTATPTKVPQTAEVSNKVPANVPQKLYYACSHDESSTVQKDGIKGRPDYYGSTYSNITLYVSYEVAVDYFSCYNEYTKTFNIYSVDISKIPSNEYIGIDPIKDNGQIDYYEYRYNNRTHDGIPVSACEYAGYVY
jgi:hypothetical protein